MDIQHFETLKIFSTVAAPFYNTISNACGFQFLHILTNMLISEFLIVVILVNGFSSYFFLSLSGTLVTQTLCLFVLPHRFLKLCSLFFHLFSFYSSDLIISIVLSSSSLVLSTCSNLPLNPLVNFSFQLLYLLAPEFLFGFFIGFLSLY